MNNLMISIMTHENRPYHARTTPSEETGVTCADGRGYYHPTLPKLNVDLLEEVIDWAERSALGKAKRDEPTWRQTAWATAMGISGRQLAVEQNFCGSSFCISGYAVQETNNLRFDPKVNDFAISREFESYAEGVVKIEYEQDWNKAGALALGLTYEEANALFSGENGLETIKAQTQAIAHTRGYHLKAAG